MREERLPRWVVVWLSVSTLIVLWDVLFVLLRPASMPGGSLAALWGPYAKYVTVDKSYGDLHDPFVPAQAWVSLFETVLVALSLSFDRARKCVPALVLALCALAMTGSKTLLIFTIQAVSGLRDVGHNELGDLIGLYVLPNIVWIVVPILAIVRLARMIGHK